VVASTLAKCSQSQQAARALLDRYSMSNTIKFAALGVAGAGVIAGAYFGIRWFLARRAAGETEVDLDNLDNVDFGDPVVVAEEVVIVEEPVTPF
jgi:hypothetical protein